MQATTIRWARAAMLGAACGALYWLSVRCEARFFGVDSVGSLVHLHTGLMLAIAVLLRDPLPLRVAVLVNLAMWQWRALGAVPGWHTATYGLLSMLGTYLLLRLAARLIRHRQASRFGSRELVRVLLVGALGVPLLLALMSLLLDWWLVQGVPLTASSLNSALQTLFAKHFGVMVMAVPILVAARHGSRALPARPWWRVALPWSVLLGIGLALLLIQIDGRLGRPLDWQAVLLDIRLIVVAVLIAATLRLPVHASMALLTMLQLLLIHSMTAPAEQTVHGQSVLDLLRVALELTILQTLVLVLWLTVRERERALRHERRLGADLRRLNAELDARVHERTQALQQAFAELRATQHELVETEKVAALGRLVAGVAHEVNTPLGIGITAVSALADELQALRTRIARSAGVERAEQALAPSLQACELAARNLARAADLVRTFRRVAVEPGAMPPSTVAVADLLQAAAAAAAAGAPRVQVAVHCADDLQATCRVDAVMQIVHALVANSLEHGFRGREQGRVELHARDDDGVLQIDYRDDGCGIDDSIAARIFEPFAGGQLARGPGLGMHIVWNLVVHLLGGRIECMPARVGAHFRIRFPCRPVDAGVAMPA